MAGPLIVKPGVVIPSGELRWRFSHASGPGGQSVNTSDTRVELSLDVARTPGLSPVERERALERLAHRLVDGVITVTRPSTVRSSATGKPPSGALATYFVRRSRLRLRHVAGRLRLGRRYVVDSTPRAGAVP